MMVAIETQLSCRVVGFKGKTYEVRQANLAHTFSDVKHKCS